MAHPPGSHLMNLTPFQRMVLALLGAILYRVMIPVERARDPGSLAALQCAMEGQIHQDTLDTCTTDCLNVGTFRGERDDG